MTNEQFRKENERLMEKLHAGEKGAREKLVRLNMSLVHKVANDMSSYCFYHHSVSVDDLFQVGCIGLLKAIDTYDPSKGAAFSTYATICVKNDIQSFTNHLIQTDKEFPTLNSPIKDNKTDTLELVDSLASNFSIEDEVFGNDEALFRATLSTLHPCEQNYLTMLFFHQSTPEQIAKEFNFLPQDVPFVTKEMLSTLKKRAKGSNSYSIVCKKYFYDHNIANFREEVYNKLSPSYKAYFDSTVLGRPLLSFKRFSEKSGLSKAQAAELHRRMDLRMDTFYCRNILEINNCTTDVVRNTLADSICGDEENAKELFSIMSKPESEASKMILEGEDSKKITTIIRRGIIKKSIYYEKMTKNCEKIAKNHII